MAIQPNQDVIDEFSAIGPDATAAFEPAGRLAPDPAEFANSENLQAAPRKSGLDEDEEEEEDDVDVDDDDDDDLEDDDEDDDLEEDDDDLEDDDEEEEDDEDEEEEDEEDEVKPLKVKR